MEQQKNSDSLQLLSSGAPLKDGASIQGFKNNIFLYGFLALASNACRNFVESWEQHL